MNRLPVRGIPGVAAMGYDPENAILEVQSPPRKSTGIAEIWRFPDVEAWDYVELSGDEWRTLSRSSLFGEIIERGLGRRIATIGRDGKECSVDVLEEAS